MRRRWLQAILVMALTPAPLLAHMGPPDKPAAAPPEKPTLRVEPVGEGAYCLYGQGGNIGIVVTPSSVVMVDTQFEALAPAIADEIRKLSPAAIRYVIDTHYHFDHTGGNKYFAKIADVVGQENVRARLYSGPVFAQANFPGRIKEFESLLSSGKPMEAAYRKVIEGRVGLYKAMLQASEGFKPEEVAAPTITYQDSMKLYLGDEEVQIFHVAPGHTDGDSIVYFPKRKVVHMGDDFVNQTYPFIDVDGGGSSQGWLKTLDVVLDKLPADTRVIPGHGPSAGVVELKRFRAYMNDLRAAVSAAIARGSSLETAVRDIKLDGYADMNAQFMTLQQNVDQVWTEMGGKK
jgi:cyclase